VASIITFSDCSMTVPANHKNTPREFLKPTIIKIFLMIDIFLILIFVPVLPRVFYPGCTLGGHCGPIINYQSFNSRFLSQVNFMIQYGNACESCPRWTDFFIYLIFYWIVSYLLSCVTIWIYQKYRQKSQNR